MTADDRDMAAAEYVLGTLPDAERAAAAARIDTDAAFARAVSGWQDRLAPLDAETPAVAPPDRVWPKIRAAVGAEAVVPRVDPADRVGAPVGAAAEVVDLAASVRRWRAAAVVFGALAAGLAALAVVDRLPQWLGTLPAGGRYVAVVNRDASLPALIVDVDTGRGVVTVRPVAAEKPEGRSLELWVIPDGGRPRSLGVVDPTAPVVTISGEKAGSIPAKGLFAITVEPPGGSPTGEPSGAPVYAGPLIPADG